MNNEERLTIIFIAASVLIVMALTVMNGNDIRALEKRIETLGEAMMRVENE